MKSFLNLADWSVSGSFAVLMNDLKPLLVPIIVSVLVNLGKLLVEFIKKKTRELKQKSKSTTNIQ